MKYFFKKIIGWLILLAILGALAYFFRAELLNFKNRFYRQYLPCHEPITYQLGEFDGHFGISRKNFLAAVASAEKIWEQPIGLNLFEYATTGTIKINLIYDYRQDATLKLRKLGIIVKNDQATYDKLKAEYAALQNSYSADKASLENKIAEFESRTAAYSMEVRNSNRRGGLSPADMDRLEAEKAELSRLWADIKIQQGLFNGKVDEINTLADTLNQLVRTLNLSVDKFNTIGESRGSEFTEGTYVSSANGEEINIYQFDDANKLTRVLAHELGHALGLEHVSSTKAIMYYLNDGINESLTPIDLAELRQYCGIK